MGGRSENSRPLSKAASQKGMTMEEALTALLLGHAPLQALVGNRIHWLVQPRHASGFPYVNLTVVSDPRSYHMAGQSGLRKTRVQVDVWAESYSSARSVERVIADFVSGFRGAGSGVNFRGVFIGGARDLTDQTTGEERQVFRISVDLQLIWNKEN